MKVVKILSMGCAVIATALLVSSCVKKADVFTDERSDFSTRAQVQTYVAIVSAAGNIIALDGARINGSTLALGNVFPGTGVAADIPSGFRSFQVTGTGQPALSFAENFQGGNYYTIFLYDTLPTPKQKTVQTNIVIPTDSTARVRFANFIYSSVAIPAVDIWSVRRGANVFTNIQTTQVTDFIPYASALSDTLMVRETGTLNQLFKLDGFNPVQKRSYTLIFRGRYQSTTGTIARTLSSFVNY